MCGKNRPWPILRRYLVIYGEDWEIPWKSCVKIAGLRDQILTRYLPYTSRCWQVFSWSRNSLPLTNPKGNYHVHKTRAIVPYSESIKIGLNPQNLLFKLYIKVACTFVFKPCYMSGASLFYFNNTRWMHNSLDENEANLII
jgi:hypothetical protein